eukprot:snap_masked-scaffold_102-processed-gene-0.10-mRNA-1 protein AED:1.00 eAED:1.00 QI:0/0/0/0/1/1/3/0/92
MNILNRVGYRGQTYKTVCIMSYQVTRSNISDKKTLLNQINNGYNVIICFRRISPDCIKKKIKISEINTRNVNIYFARNIQELGNFVLRQYLE